MKTVRQHTFETNSSSTHSITIVNRTDVKSTNRNYLEVQKDGILIPANLKQSAAYVPIDTGYDSGFILTASTRDQKAALLLHHAKSYMVESWDRTFDDEESTKILQFIRDYLVQPQGIYLDVDLDFSPDFDAYSETGKCYIIDILNNKNVDEIFSALAKHIDEVVLNDDMIVIASNEPY